LACSEGWSNTLSANATGRITHHRAGASLCILAPAYDLVSTIAYISDEQAALKFSRTRRFDEFSEDELAHLAARALLPKRLVLDTARETVAAFHQTCSAEERNPPLSNDVIKAIETHLKSMPIA
jgi:serine/threonine-protein kinase HipA